MIYLDTSVVLAAVFDENRRPPDALWREALVSSRLLEYELNVRCHARKVQTSVVASVLARIALVELAPTVLERALAPFPAAVRTLDALHLATAIYLREHGQQLAIATYDERMATAALALGLPLHEL